MDFIKFLLTLSSILILQIVTYASPDHISANFVDGKNADSLSQPLDACCYNRFSLLADIQLTNCSTSSPHFLQGVNSTNITINSLQKKDLNTNITTGLGQIIGNSTPVKPPYNASPTNQEPERLVPDIHAFEQAKNDSNSPCPSEKLLKSLENKNIIQP